MVECGIGIGEPSRRTTAHRAPDERGHEATGHLDSAALPSFVLAPGGLGGVGHLRFDDRIRCERDEGAVEEQVELEFNVFGEVIGEGAAAEDVGAKDHPVAVQTAARAEPGTPERSEVVPRGERSEP